MLLRLALAAALRATPAAAPAAAPAATLAAAPAPAPAPAPASAPAATPSTPPTPPIGPADLDAHRRRTALGLAGMGTLTGWAVTNIAGGVIGHFTTTGAARAFHQGNAAWNTVNLALGIGGLVSQRRERRVPVDRATGRDRARRAQVAFGINAGLDVLYMSAGSLLWTLSRDRGHARLLGYGQALVLQGGFLFLFDVAMMAGHEWQLTRAPRATGARRRLRPLATRPRGGGLVVGMSLDLG